MQLFVHIRFWKKGALEQGDDSEADRARLILFTFNLLPEEFPARLSSAMGDDLGGLEVLESVTADVKCRQPATPAVHKRPQHRHHSYPLMERMMRSGHKAAGTPDTTTGDS